MIRPGPSPWTLKVPRTVDIKVQLLESFEPITSNVMAYVELGRSDQWKSIGNGEGRELSVLRATLRGVVVHQGIRLVRVTYTYPRY